MSNDRSNEGSQEHVQRRAGIKRRDLLLGGTALLTAAAFSDAANAQTPDSIKTRKASCICGKLTVTTKGPDPERISLCSCKNCQKQTGSAFSLQATFPKEQVTIEGKSTAWRFPEGAAPTAPARGSRVISAPRAVRPFTMCLARHRRTSGSMSAPSPTRRSRRQTFPASKSTDFPGLLMSQPFRCREDIITSGGLGYSFRSPASVEHRPNSGDGLVGQLVSRPGH
jgi:Glutathione-dependent formaldehyde-activating enzyme